MAEVDTKELELQILKMKTDRVVQHVNDLAERTKKHEVSPREVIEELMHDRKELIDCVTLELGIEFVGPIAAQKIVETISQIDLLLFRLRLAVGLGL